MRKTVITVQVILHERGAESGSRFSRLRLLFSLECGKKKAFVL